jgi:methylated-DNA-[protein]-cysteine S-methyltransferase
MTSMNNDAPGMDGLLQALADLAADSVELIPRIFAHWCKVRAPTGEVYVAFTDRGACYLRTSESVHGDDALFGESFRERFGRPLILAQRAPAGLLPALRTGRLRNLPLDLRGLSEFERSVLRAATLIPPGQIRPYLWIASQIERPRAVRAVGSALGRNPLPLLIPCHRVIRSDGDVGGYVFGREFKERLLRAETVDLDEVRRFASQRVFYLGSDTTNIVCFPTCPSARRITEPHRRGFRSIGQAQRAGYRPCLRCRPGVIAG